MAVRLRLWMLTAIILLIIDEEEAEEEERGRKCEHKTSLVIFKNWYLAYVKRTGYLLTYVIFNQFARQPWRPFPATLLGGEVGNRRYTFPE